MQDNSSVIEASRRRWRLDKPGGHRICGAPVADPGLSGASNRVERNLEIAHAVRLGGWQLAGAHIDLHRRQNQCRHGQRRITRPPHGNELFLAHAIVHVDVAFTLGTDGRFPRGPTAFGRIVVTHEEAGIGRQVQQPANGAVQFMRIAAGKVAAGCTDVWHEERVADKDCIANPICHVCGGVARHMQRLASQAANGKLLVFLEQVVEL